MTARNLEGSGNAIVLEPSSFLGQNPNELSADYPVITSLVLRSLGDGANYLNCQVVVANLPVYQQPWSQIVRFHEFDGFRLKIKSDWSGFK